MTGKAVSLGVHDAFCAWLSEHFITVPDVIHDAVKEAFAKWLEDHTEELLDRIASKAGPAAASHAEPSGTDPSVDALELSVRALQAVRNSHQRTLPDLAEFGRRRLMKMGGCGAKCANEIEAELARFGVKLQP